ncbi:DUF5694 domain-containing protein [Zunongwangia atlantica]|uniref:TraB/GumN family protein n=1 Tax=Zunongwangia atlantica 22II14-10F7 TaxID=1185767 RepID=A0A1Y1T195_9FLAO|nr:DUF5694 domain-containing protein [Zunongwangia atlantica]ORL44786.1 hypothetical protein IIF7_13307 [Zunongwangia atlantica 22II14-10F7]
MKSILISILISFISSQLFAQSDFKDPDEFLRKGEQVPKVLLVGSFHFNYPGLDAHKAAEDNKINIYSEKRQKELQELLDYISKFKPTKIMIEAYNSSKFIKNWKAYKSGKAELYASERSQIGMRLVIRFGLDTIYGVDSGDLLYKTTRTEEYSNTNSYLDSIANRHYFGGDDEMMKRYKNFYAYKDTLAFQNSLLETFKYMNSDKVLDRAFGAYISGGQFTSEEMEGPDALSMLWMNRNLRIFRKIQRIEHTPDDRILVIFGAAHIAILNWLYESTPEFDLVKFNEL